MNEHRWRFKAGSRHDDYRATTMNGSPVVEVLADDEWIHWTGEPIAGEILRLVGELARVEREHAWTGARLADLLLKEQELFALTDSLEGKGQQTRPLSRAEIAERIRDILRLPE